MRHGLLLAGITLLWLVGLNIDWDCLVPHCIMGSRDQWEFPLFQTTVTVPLHCRRLPLGLCNGTVKECTVGLDWDLLYLKIASNIQQKYNFFIITKQGTYVNKCVKSSNWTKFHCSSLNKNTLETCKNPRPTSGWSELTKSCTTSTMNFHMAYFSWIPQNNAKFKLSCKFGESKCNPC